MNDFINKLGWTKGLEISNLRRVLPWTYKEVLLKNRGKDLYIVWGKKTWLMKRCWNNDIISKSYFILDIDIRDNYKKLYNEVMSQSALDISIWALIELLDGDGYLSQWSYVVNSGNWAHIYYCGDALIIWKDITPEEYARWVKKIYDIYVKYLEYQSKIYKTSFEYFYPDYMCCNIARTTRLPSSFNNKKKYWLPSIQVTFHAYQDMESTLMKKLPQLWEERKKPKKRKKYKKNKSGQWYKQIDVNNYSISELIRRYTWKQIGKENISCPFPWHTDKEASFSVNEKENYFNCFSKCGGWNPANFIAKMEDISYWEAIRKLDQEF